MTCVWSYAVVRRAARSARLLAGDPVQRQCGQTASADRFRVVGCVAAGAGVSGGALGTVGSVGDAVGAEVLGDAAWALTDGTSFDAAFGGGGAVVDSEVGGVGLGTVAGVVGDAVGAAVLGGAVGALVSAFGADVGADCVVVDAAIGSAAFCSAEWAVGVLDVCSGGCLAGPMLLASLLVPLAAPGFLASRSSCGTSAFSRVLSCCALSDVILGLPLGENSCAGLWRLSCGPPLCVGP